MPTASPSPVDFLIITALEEEREAVLAKLPRYERITPSETDIRVYYTADLPVTFPDNSTGIYKLIIMSLLGIGRVQATMATSDAIRRWQPRYIILIGIAGGIAHKNVKIGDVLISDQIVDYELQKLTSTESQIYWEVYHTDPRILGAVSNFSSNWQTLIRVKRPSKGMSKRHVGPIASGDKMIVFGEALAKYGQIWSKLIGIEMEAGGVAAATFQAAKPPGFFMIRGVSDLADEQKHTAPVERWRSYACDAAASYIIALLKSGPVPLSSTPDLLKKDQDFSLLNRVHQPAYNHLTPASNLDAVSELSIEFTYGTMPPGSKFYIERKADIDCWRYIRASEAVTLFIQAPRQMGKSSLMRRMIHRAEVELNKPAVFIDFQKIPAQYFEDEASFMKEFCLMMAEALQIPSETVNQSWQGGRTSIQKCRGYLSDYVIPKVGDPFIMALDEVDRLIHCPFRSNFFGMLRSWHNDRAYDKKFAKMTLFLSSATEPYLLINQPHQSPFNVAKRITLYDFTGDEVAELHQRHALNLASDQLHQLVDFIQGHPFLTRLAFYQLATGETDWNTLFAQATEDSGPFWDHLHYYLLQILEKPDLKQFLVQISYTPTHEENQFFHQLRSIGLIKKDKGQIVWRNKLYERYFKERLNG